MLTDGEPFEVNARGEPRALFIPRRIRRQVVIGRQRLMCIWRRGRTR